MNKLFILMGKSASGKSTLESRINEIGLAKKVISSTTRKARSYEEDGVDYYFIILNKLKIIIESASSPW